MTSAGLGTAPSTPPPPFLPRWWPYPFLAMAWFVVGLLLIGGLIAILVPTCGATCPPGSSRGCEPCAVGVTVELQFIAVGAAFALLLAYTTWRAIKRPPERGIQGTSV